MQHISIRIINEEHASLSSVLQSIRMMLKRGHQNSPEAFFDVMRAMLFTLTKSPKSNITSRSQLFYFHFSQLDQLTAQMSLNNSKKITKMANQPFENYSIYL